MAYVDARTDCTLARLKVLLYRIQCRVFHDQYQIRRREHRRQDTVFKPVRQMLRFNSMHILALRAVRNRFHGIQLARNASPEELFSVTRLALARSNEPSTGSAQSSHA